MSLHTCGACKFTKIGGLDERSNCNNGGTESDQCEDGANLSVFVLTDDNARLLTPPKVTDVVALMLRDHTAPLSTKARVVSTPPGLSQTLSRFTGSLAIRSQLTLNLASLTHLDGERPPPSLSVAPDATSENTSGDKLL